MCRLGLEPNAQELSRVTGIPGSHRICERYLAGTRIPDYAAITLLARTLGVSIDYLLTGYGDGESGRIPLLQHFPLSIHDLPRPITEFIDRGDIEDPTAFAVRVWDNDMSPVLCPTDIAVISPDTPFEPSGCIAAVALTKRMRGFRWVEFGERNSEKIAYLYTEDDERSVPCQPQPLTILLGKVVERREKL
jgi:transcriptional regulator with XRE-family HTH domain